MTCVSIGVEGSIEISTATVGAPTLVVPIFVPKLFSSICFSWGLLYRLYSVVDNLAPCLIPRSLLKGSKRLRSYLIFVVPCA